jgi:hypothetical protein
MTEFSNLKMTLILLGRLFLKHKPFRYQKDYDNALRVLNVGSWYFLYYALEGPNAEQVCVALNKCMKALEIRDILEEQLEEYKQYIGLKHAFCILPKVMPLPQEHHLPEVQHLPQDQFKTVYGLYQSALSARETEKALRHDLNVLVYGKDTEGCGYESD